ncbi:hypothetical protein BD779DRAFT_1803440 [Infundibulicybe gibba]|nr:hypothetical protein BD779DRAFT_1803440 [Infundibulicybe gibba]
MPTVLPGSTILVTGANGFIGMWVVRELLEKGYREAFIAYGDKLEMVVVEDITKEGAFDEAIQGVSAVEHIASPLIHVDDPQLIIRPAVDGTIGILQSALKSKSKLLKRIVVTSSVAAIQGLNPTPEPIVLSETNWNDEVVRFVEEKGKGASGAIKYDASKTLAERAAWSFLDKHRHEVGWDLVCLNPPYVYGPSIHDVKIPSDLSISSLDWYTRMGLMGSVILDHQSVDDRCWVDVRDVANVHVLALETPEAGGERIIICAGPSVWQDWLDAANALFPPGTSQWKFLRGEPGRKITCMTQYDTSKASRIFGMKYRSMEETITDTLAGFQRLGW